MSDGKSEKCGSKPRLANNLSSAKFDTPLLNPWLISDLTQCQLIYDERILSLPSRSIQAPTFPNEGRYEAQLELRGKEWVRPGLAIGPIYAHRLQYCFFPSFSRFNPRILLTIKVSSVCLWHASSRHMFNFECVACMPLALMVGQSASLGEFFR
jgi:hypothetical protein